MIEKMQIASKKFRRAKCQKCKKKIPPLEVRGVVSGGLYFGFLCSKCTKEYMDGIPKRLEKMKRKFNKFIKMTNKEKEIYLTKQKILDSLEDKK